MAVAVASVIVVPVADLYSSSRVDVGLKRDNERAKEREPPLSCC